MRPPPLFSKETGGLGFVHNVLDRYGQIIAAVVGGVDAVGDGDETHPVGREYPAQIPAGFNVLAPQPGEVFLCQVGTKKNF